jgi:pimeloyl-ACP methyl ester carboxylesterase
MKDSVRGDTMRRVVSTAGRVVAALALVALVIAAAGAIYNVVSLRHDRAIAGVPGHLYHVDGYSMHLYCTGHGDPTVVLATGLGDDFTIWGKVQPSLSTVTRVCSYDRAGFGWSQSRPGVQDANAIAAQLHQLVVAAGVERPFVLMGHSISGLYLRSYAAHYRGDLAGLVFVDGSTPLQDDRVPRELVRIQDQQRREMPWDKFLVTLGWYRMKGACAATPPGFESYSQWIKADCCVPSQIDAIENELDAVRASGEETIHAGPFGSLPILIFSRDPKSLPSNWPAEVAQANSVVWNQMQEEAKGLSTQSRRIIAKGSDHYVQLNRADLVNQEVTAFLTHIREHQFPAEENHTTVDE